MWAERIQDMPSGPHSEWSGYKSGRKSNSKKSSGPMGTKGLPPSRIPFDAHEGPRSDGEDDLDLRLDLLSEKDIPSAGRSSAESSSSSWKADFLRSIQDRHQAQAQQSHDFTPHGGPEQDRKNAPTAAPSADLAAWEGEHMQDYDSVKWKFQKIWDDCSDEEAEETSHAPSRAADSSWDIAFSSPHDSYATLSTRQTPWPSQRYDASPPGPQGYGAGPPGFKGGFTPAKGSSFKGGYTKLSATAPCFQSWQPYGSYRGPLDPASGSGDPDSEPSNGSGSWGFVPPPLLQTLNQKDPVWRQGDQAPRDGEPWGPVRKSPPAPPGTGPAAMPTMQQRPASAFGLDLGHTTAPITVEASSLLELEENTGQQATYPVQLRHRLQNVLGTDTVLQLRHGLIDSRVVAKRMKANVGTWPSALVTHAQTLSPCAVIAAADDEDPEYCWVIYPHCEFGTLGDWIQSHTNVGRILPPSDMVMILKGILQAASALLQCQSELTVFRTDEIFIDSHRQPRLRLRHDSPPLFTLINSENDAAAFPLKWMSPDEIKGLQQQQHGWPQEQSSTDLWAMAIYRVGLLLYCIGAGTPDPYPSKTAGTVFMDLCHEALSSNPPVRPDMSKYRGPHVLRDLVLNCLSPQAKNRPDLDQIKVVIDILAACPV
eukprot:gnl/TRDRNA2_/TRDRNA2_75249_c1_seq1.p1 gnl/TRDRNA2_/TRDRNA2_75249_c1~~gnl/TRDRNA2_/TRDRNA2_75249_c1_seq1.p1  ORF type:complete len:750 (-),score=122.02 gnl/TRDRNA2_/TRDRNA2_75249_c1_seq1:209-2167(-)